MINISLRSVQICRLYMFNLLGFLLFTFTSSDMCIYPCKTRHIYFPIQVGLPGALLLYPPFLYTTRLVLSKVALFLVITYRTVYCIVFSRNWWIFALKLSKRKAAERNWRHKISNFHNCFSWLLSISNITFISVIKLLWVQDFPHGLHLSYISRYWC